MLSLGFKTRTLQPIGLDIGHNSIKMIQLAVSGEHIAVLAADEMPIASAVFEDGQARKSFIVSAVKQMLAKGSFHGTRAVSCLQSDELKITSLRLTETESEKTEQVLKHEVTERFGLDPDKDAMDYIIAGNVRQGDDMKNELILFAAGNETLKNHIEMLEQAGLQPVAIDIIPCALFRSFARTLRRQQDKESAVVFVDVGSNFTTIVFGREGEISFVKQIAIGADKLNQEAASRLGIGGKEAEMLRKDLQAENSYSMPNLNPDEQTPDENQHKIDATTRQVIVDSISKIAEELAKEISLCLRYYTVTFRGKRVERAVFTGGGCYEKILLDTMRRQLGVDVEVAQPLKGIDLSDERANLNFYSDRRGLLCEWAVAVGLSLKGWKPPKSGRQGLCRKASINYERN
jgi:type IV pilus assembly protein PilM